ncbi:hypothetical protein [Levilactobacillus parabrevis]|uniref:hypothetical protein n=1 Tax=Levilactobacillus parabrevis TaxID=357278 RepID=UPI0003788F4C|nr:hypothetical protein [Levilactobacillus parabrevis]
MISPNIHFSSSEELDHDIRQRMVDRGCSNERAGKLMLEYRELIKSWKYDYTTPNRGTHQSAANIADNIIMYDKL